MQISICSYHFYWITFLNLYTSHISAQEQQQNIRTNCDGSISGGGGGASMFLFVDFQSLVT